MSVKIEYAGVELAMLISALKRKVSVRVGRVPISPLLTGPIVKEEGKLLPGVVI
jgi:hypothetical protein